MDWQSCLYDPIYTAIGVDASLTLTNAPSTDIRVLDKTAGIDISEKGAEVATIAPAATVRLVELQGIGIGVGDLPDALLEMSGTSWRVVSTRFRPSPNDETDGEVLLVLEQADL